ncbi:MAG: inverse autotransporter beta domain-containing protein [Candidatus Symbiodolus clandestinus]
MQPLVQRANRWLDNSGQIEVTLADSVTETVPHLGWINVLLPIWSTADQLLFLQGGTQYQYDNKEINLGVGQRWFTAKAVYWGYSLFYDQLYHSNHRRLGLGIEQHSGYRTLYLNAYLPLSRWQLVDNGNHRQRPAFGFDLCWQQRLSRYPECCWRVIGEHYFADQLAANELQNKQPAKTVVSIGIDYTPFSLLNLGYSYQLAKGRQGVHQFQLSLVYRLGVPFSQQLQSVRELRESSDIYRLALVQREKSIKLQQVAINRDQKSPVSLHISIFDKTEEQADDKPPNSQSTSGQENPGCDQLQEISKSSQSAPAVSSKETPADDAPSVVLPEMVGKGRGHTSLDPEKVLSESPRCGSGENPLLESNLSASVSKFPGLVPGKPLPKGRTGKKKPGYSKSFNVKAAPHKAISLLSLQEQRDVQEKNAKENSAPFQPPTVDPPSKVARLSMSSCSTQATNPPNSSLELENLGFSQEEWSVNSEGNFLNETTPRSYEGSIPTFVTPPKERKTKESIPHDNILRFREIIPDTPFNGVKGEKKTDAFKSFSEPPNPQSTLESKNQTKTRSSFDTPTFGNTSSEINVNLSSETLDSSNFNQSSPSSSTTGEERIVPSERSGMLPINALAFSHGADLSLKHSKRVPKNRKIKQKRNVKPAHFFLRQKKLEARECAVKVGLQDIKSREAYLANGQNRLEAEKRIFADMQQQDIVALQQKGKQLAAEWQKFSIQQKKLETERSALQNDWQVFDSYVEDQKQTRVQLIADRRSFQIQQEELNAEELALKTKEQELNAVESYLQQVPAQLNTAERKIQSQWKELEARERAVETKQQELFEKETKLQRREAQLVVNQQGLQTQQNVDPNIQRDNFQPLQKSVEVNIESLIFSPPGEAADNRKRVRDSDAPMPENKRRKLNEEGSGSLSKISNEPSITTDIGNAVDIDIQTQQESHQPSEQSSDDQTREQSAGTNSGENRASNQVMNNSTTNSNKLIVKINQLTQSEMKELVEGKGYQFGQKSIEKIFEQRDNGTFIRDEAHFKQVVGRQNTQILQRIELDYTYSDTF